MPPRPFFTRPEDALQKSIVSYCRLVLPEGWLIFSVPNGGKRSKATAGILKATGVLSGVSDLVIIGPWKFALFAEVKTAKGVVMPEQYAFHETVRAMGFYGAIWRSVDDAANTFKALGVPVKGELQ
jgi:hypothetical protein